MSKELFALGPECLAGGRDGRRARGRHGCRHDPKFSRRERPRGGRRRPLRRVLHPPRRPEAAVRAGLRVSVPRVRRVPGPRSRRFRETPPRLASSPTTTSVCTPTVRRHLPPRHSRRGEGRRQPWWPAGDDLQRDAREVSDARAQALQPGGAHLGGQGRQGGAAPDGHQEGGQVHVADLAIHIGARSSFRLVPLDGTPSGHRLVEEIGLKHCVEFVMQPGACTGSITTRCTTDARRGRTAPRRSRSFDDAAQNPATKTSIPMDGSASARWMAAAALPRLAVAVQLPPLPDDPAYRYLGGVAAGAPRGLEPRSQRRVFPRSSCEAMRAKHNCYGLYKRRFA